MSQTKSLNFLLCTPPLLYSTEPAASLNDEYRSTPSISSGHHDTLEPPAWKPPEAEEVEYTDAWNNMYNNQHHFLQPDFPKDDSSVGSNLTSNSLMNKIIISNAPALRPRGISLSITDAGSIGSCPHTRRGCAQHHRIYSLPVSFFSSTSQQVFHSERDNQSQSQLNKQYLNALQTTKQRAPCELHSHYNQSQAQADGAMGGLDGILLDLYVVDRSVDSAAAKMLATKGGGGSGVFMQNGYSHSYPKKSRRTSLGTLNNIQCILELHKVDKIVDRFKQDLQMPEFLEEEAWEDSVLKDLRRTDVVMEESARKLMSKKEREETGKVRYEFNVMYGEDNADQKGDQGMGAEDGMLLDESFVTDHDAYKFFDPHEIEVPLANSYQYSQVAASIHDDLHDIIDLLRTDLEVNVASRRQKEMEMIRPLLEIDQQMNTSKELSKTRLLWDADLKALYLTDLEIDAAKRKCALAPHKLEMEINVVSPTAESRSSFTKLLDPLSSVESTMQTTNFEGKDKQSHHAPRVLDQFDATAQSADFALPSFAPTNPPLPPPAPASSPQVMTKRVLFSAPGTVDANAAPVATSAKRSIFSQKEKSAAANNTFQSGLMMPGTTTVVLAKGGEMIDDIPVGRVIMR
jgi:hypothetical protein